MAMCEANQVDIDHEIANSSLPERVALGRMSVNRCGRADHCSVEPCLKIRRGDSIPARRVAQINNCASSLPPLLPSSLPPLLPSLHLPFPPLPFRARMHQALIGGLEARLDRHSPGAPAYRRFSAGEEPAPGRCRRSSGGPGEAWDAVAGALARAAGRAPAPARAADTPAVVADGAPPPEACRPSLLGSVE